MQWIENFLIGLGVLVMIVVGLLAAASYAASKGWNPFR